MTNEEKLLTVETSNRYDVAPCVAFQLAVNPVVVTDEAVVATGEEEIVTAVMVLDTIDSTPAELTPRIRYLYVVPELMAEMLAEVAVPVRLSKPANVVLKLSLDNSRFKLVAPETAFQLAVKAVALTEEATIATGVVGFVLTVMVFELADVLEPFAARTL